MTIREKKGLEQTPALILVQAILAELDQETRRKVIRRLAAQGARSSSARQAFEVANSTMLDFADGWELMKALETAWTQD